ncbi:hypothetical protein CHCC20442_4325 [Bacillus licheniformis]|uniref:hypothetical protein n=1 Tax=Bacillus licheniformis TaxID=1402 RepID=UPI0011A04510|nr:hypothetical protein [Bacillus licheniformis]TWK08612.1 hypothetical protein CHCC20442_4325 [Bacillus licheniformis]
MDNLLPGRYKVDLEFIDTIHNIKEIQHKYKFSKYDAVQAMKAIEKELNAHKERYEKLYKPFYDSLDD